MTKTALITGSRGFVGRHMTHYLRERDFDVHGIDLVDDVKHDAFSVFRLDAPRYDLVVHAAAQSPHRVGIDTNAESFPYNLALDAELFEWAIRTGQSRIVYLSSSAVYSNQLHRRAHGHSFREYEALEFEPFDDYGRTKRIGEVMAQRAQATGVKVTVVRPFSGYGSDQSTLFPFGAFKQRALERQDPFRIWGSAEQVRDWIHIDDVVAAIYTLAELDVNVPVNLCTGVGTSMRELAKAFMRATGDESYRPPIAVVNDAPLGVMHRVGNPDLFNRFYGSRISIDEGVERAMKESE